MNRSEGQGRPTGWRWVGIGGAIALMVIIGVVAATRDDEPERAEPGDVIEGFYGAMNSGDADGMAAAWPSADEGMFTMLADGLTQRASVSCGPGGQVSVVRCEELVIRNDFYQPTGLRAEFTVDYALDEGRIIDAQLVDMSQDTFDFRQAFGAWLDETHPEVVFDRLALYPFETVEQADAAIGLMGEFLAQSDTYPIGN